MTLEENLPSFKIFFNKKRQWLDVFLWDVHPNTFSNWGGGKWGYFISKGENPRKGLLGEIHLVKSRVREDTVVHEIDHARTEWMLRAGITITRTNEEKMATFLDELVRKFYREYRKEINVRSNRKRK